MKINNLIKILLKITISFIFIYAVLRKLDLNELLIEFKNIRLSFFILALLLYLSTMFFSTKRWSYFVKADKNFFQLFELYMVGAFFNIFLPGTVGGDVVKAYYLYKGTQKRGDSLVSVFMERYMGMLALISIASVATLIGFQHVKDTFALKFFIIIVTIFIAGTIFVSFFPYEIFYKKLKDVRASIKYFIFQKDIFLKTLFLSLTIQGIGIFVVFLLSKSINIDIAISYHFIFIPIITVISMIPISFSGVGLREYSFLHFYSIAGLTEEKAVTLSLLWFIIMIITGLIGFLFYIKIGTKKIEK